MFMIWKLLPLSLLFLACTSYAQSPNTAFSGRPIRVIAPFPPGSAGDIIPRAISPAANEALKQMMIIDNRAGAAGSIAAEIVARAAPDGLTLLFGTTGVLAINPALYPKLPYDPVRDFAPVARVATSQYAVLAAPTLPIKTLKDYIDYARARPGELNVASSGVGTAVHLSGELFHSMTGIKVVHVAYKGATEAITDLMVGRVHIMFASLSSAIPFVRSGKVKVLALTGAQRHPSAPDIPTVKEASVPEYEASGFFGYLAPVGTPPAIIARMNTEVNKILKDPAFQKKLADIGATPLGGTPKDLSTHLASELDKWGVVIKAAGIKPQ
jgi:tripartite-type tricarboxylate transporter receptor subunit TctC